MFLFARTRHFVSVSSLTSFVSLQFALLQAIREIIVTAQFRADHRRLTVRQLDRIKSKNNFPVHLELNDNEAEYLITRRILLLFFFSFFIFTFFLFLFRILHTFSFFFFFTSRTDYTDLSNIIYIYIVYKYKISLGRWNEQLVLLISHRDELGRIDENHRRDISPTSSLRFLPFLFFSFLFLEKSRISDPRSSLERSFKPTTFLEMNLNRSLLPK